MCELWFVAKQQGRSFEGAIHGLRKGMAGNIGGMWSLLELTPVHLRDEVRSRREIRVCRGVRNTGLRGDCANAQLLVPVLAELLETRVEQRSDSGALALGQHLAGMRHQSWL